MVALWDFLGFIYVDSIVPKLANAYARRFALSALTIVVGVALSGVFALERHTSETNDILENLGSGFRGLASDLEYRINGLGVAGDDMAAFAAAAVAYGGFFGERQFLDWAKVRRETWALAPRVLYWRPLVKRDDRQFFEALARATGAPDFAIRDLGGSGSPEPAPMRERYLPMLYAVTAGGRLPGILGLDGLGDGEGRATLERAWQTGISQMSPPHRVPGLPPTWSPAVFFASPVFAALFIPDATEDRRAQFVGAVGTIYPLAEIIDHALKGTEWANAEILLGTAPFAADGSGRYAVRYDAGEGMTDVPPEGAAVGPSDHRLLFHAIRLGGIDWHLMARISETEISARRTWEPWLMLLIGLLLTAGITAAVENGQRRRGQLRLEIASSHTQLKAAETQLATARIQFSTLVTASPAAIICLDTKGQVVLWNPAAERLLGYPAGETLGKPMPVYPRCTQGAADGWGTCQTNAGNPVSVFFYSVPLHDDHGRGIGTIYVIYDQTDRVELEKQLRQAQKMEAVGQLTGGIAHDFNNLLGIIIGNLDLMEEELPAEIEELRQAALSAALRGADLTRALLAFSRRQELNPAPVDVGSLLDGFLRLLQRLLGEQIEVSLEKEAGLWPIHIDAAQLESAIANLAINARDAMPDGGRLLIAARNAKLDEDYVTHNPEAVAGDYTLIEVADTGCGMPPEVLARAFEPFFTTKATDKGTGLGLAMVYGFVKQSGGHIKIYSEAGHGTAVRLYLPRLRDDVVPARAPGEATSLSGEGETVLVVEDNAELRQSMVRQLRSLGYRIVEAENGPDAMMVLANGMRIDLLFSDVVMPGGMTGFEVAREARKRQPDLKILLTSGFPGNLSAEKREIEPGFKVELLSKPFRKDQLARKIREVLTDG